MAPPPRFEGLPDIIYGTAFKFEKSATLVEAALKAGFRAIDTAGSKSAYREALVGEGIAAAIAGGVVKREELYIQTKFSPFKTGKDPALYPYDTTLPITQQVAQSLASSLANLGTTYIDCLVLHSLYPSIEDTLTAYRAMESLVHTGAVSSLGLSNIDLISLRHIFSAATIKPVCVQNRFTIDTLDKPNPAFPKDLPYPLTPWDRDVRALCAEKGVVYAPWGMLWGSLDELDEGGVLGRVAVEVGISREIACYAVVRALGEKGCRVCLLCGTTDEGRMRETLEGLRRVVGWRGESEENMEVWKKCVESVGKVVDG